jgi:hypothetical protein
MTMRIFGEDRRVPTGSLNRTDTPANNASVTCLFTCNSAEGATGALNPTGEDQVAVVNTGGEDGYTNVGTLEWAAFGFVEGYVKSGGNINEAVGTAQQHINNSANAGRAVDKGDTLAVEPLQRKKTN